VKPGAPIYYIDSWIQTDVKPHGWYSYLEATFHLDFDGSEYLIFDDGQATYWDHSLWNSLFKNPRGQIAGAIVFASYGSPASSMPTIPTPMLLTRQQSVSLCHHDYNDGTGSAGLLFTRDEFSEFIQHRHANNRFSTDFLQQLHERTEGHIGAINKLLEFIENTGVCNPSFVF
jgi:hypothetical protein